MLAKQIIFKSIDRNDYKDYLNKALEFSETMSVCLEKRKWNSAALEAVHCAISVNDALTIWFKGIKCTSLNHEDSVTLLQSLSDIEGIKENATHLLRVIKKKNLIEYEKRNFNEEEAKNITLHASRFLNWVRSILP